MALESHSKTTLLKYKSLLSYAQLSFLLCSSSVRRLSSHMKTTTTSHRERHRSGRCTNAFPAGRRSWTTRRPAAWTWGRFCSPTSPTPSRCAHPARETWASATDTCWPTRSWPPTGRSGPKWSRYAAVQRLNLAWKISCFLQSNLQSHKVFFFKTSMLRLVFVGRGAENQRRRTGHPVHWHRDTETGNHPSAKIAHQGASQEKQQTRLSITNFSFGT